jgi:DNA topoisomerase IB
VTQRLEQTRQQVGNEVRFRFTRKGGKQWLLRVRDRRVAKIIRARQELPGQQNTQELARFLQQVVLKGTPLPVNFADPVSNAEPAS